MHLREYGIKQLLHFASMPLSPIQTSSVGFNRHFNEVYARFTLHPTDTHAAADDGVHVSAHVCPCCTCMRVPCGCLCTWSVC